ncbi:hypothetical protein [Streptomyces lomondensis]|uniref:Integral membrane protein n=1 Tax=Streptomyces lomondensis TaxID=68229 RepID=A0ABQ2XJA7_9ACTN|nr:hypothetical protein [Streptomyces lomondensis]MCF0079660.1 hypothetical protein [Streptomyces lomondensis]GGX19611.1 hypothetical protein GCM10010383_57120 [Streptomyces lomondensis]
MADGANAILVRMRRREQTDATGTARRRRVDRPLAALAGVFTLAQLVLVRPVLGLGWDEIVYVSQVTSHTPAAFFSAPRSRGVSLLVAPIASWSSSTPLLRVYLALLSGLALYLALRTWRGLFPTRVLVVGGALFASLWVTLFYGPQAMPNYWVAIGALISVGCFLRARAERSARAALWGVAAGAALMAWMRPTDAVYVTVPLLVLALARRHWRPLLALVAGLAAGAVPWVIEAYLGHGGLGQRLSDASRIQGGLGWQIAVDDQLRSLGGRALCRPCTGTMPHPLVTLWWFVLPVLAGLGLLVAARARRLGRTLIPLACAATAALPYLFMIGYAAPRFLQPAYALLAIPVADALWYLVKTPRGKWRPVAAALVAVGLAGHLAVQIAVLERTVARNTDSRRDWDRTAGELHRLGVRPPCLLTGHEALPIGYYAGCSSGATAGHNENTTAADILRTAERLPVAHLAPAGGTPPGYARAWPVHRISDLDVRVAPQAPPRTP